MDKKNMNMNDSTKNFARLNEPILFSYQKISKNFKKLCRDKKGTNFFNEINKYPHVVENIRDNSL